MSFKASARVLISVTAVAGLIAPAAGQATTFDSVSAEEPGPQHEPEHFGANVGTTTIPAQAFRGLPAIDATGFATSGCFTPPIPPGYAPLDLPNGAEITQLCAVVNDFSARGAVSLALVGWEYPNVDGGAPTPAQVLANVSTDFVGIPGIAVACLVPAVPIRVRSSGNLDGDADAGWTAYALRAAFFFGPCGGQPTVASGGDLLGFGAAVVSWRRTVAPAPSVATFADVPTSHPFFPFVEALASSGITTGCGGQNFCPGDPLTRGQMAAFLAKALGLHWPN